MKDVVHNYFIVQERLQNIRWTYSTDHHCSNTSVAAHLRGMRPAPTTQKDTLMLRKNSNTNNINQTLDYVLLDYS